MFNLDKVHVILEELVLDGDIVETNKRVALNSIQILDKYVSSFLTRNLLADTPSKPMNTQTRKLAAQLWGLWQEMSYLLWEALLEVLLELPLILCRNPEPQPQVYQKVI